MKSTQMIKKVGFNKKRASINLQATQKVYIFAQIFYKK